MNKKFPTKTFIYTCFIVSIWTNLSEVFRYFLIVMPMLKDYLNLHNSIAQMSIPIFLIWGVWDTVLVIMNVFFYWLFAERFGYEKSKCIVAASLSWLYFFFLLWLGIYNMQLASLKMILIILPMAWIEHLVAILIARKYLQSSN